MKTKIVNIIYFLSILFFLIAFNFQHNPPSGWYQQLIPDLGGREIADIIFTDSLTGYFVTSRLSPTDTSFILKTTNGGDNWIRNYETSPFIFKKIQFINENTGFAGGTKLLKTINQGENWNIVNTPFQSYLDDFHILNDDTIWFVMSEGLTGGVFRTTNGGASWQQQFSIGAGSGNPDQIYMYDANTGFISNESISYLRKTTNRGINWEVIPGATGFTDIHFIDENTGWKAKGDFKKTTNGGLNWNEITLPPATGIILISQIVNFHVLNPDTIWAVGAEAFFGAGQFRGLVYITTDGGNVWGYQLPDTSIHSNIYRNIQFMDKNRGWSYWNSGGVRTVSGGDTTIILNIQPIAGNITEEFRLFQNYPNPFNPVTAIRFSVNRSTDISLKIYDIQGKELAALVNEKLNGGEYEVIFDGSYLSSGVYFYKLESEGYTETKKMVLVR
jgi:photosystem II stability/assembly factor-like uncharacterized protein